MGENKRIRRTALQKLEDDLAAAKVAMEEAQAKAKEAEEKYKELLKQYEAKNNEEFLKAIANSSKSRKEIMAFITGKDA